MDCCAVTFAESRVAISYDTLEAEEYLSLLFNNFSTWQVNENPRLALHFDQQSGSYLLRDGTATLHLGKLDVKLAACLYDTVIYHLINKAETGIALHAGGLICGGKTILLPGQSGAGKSTLTAWLTAKQCVYLSDELIFISTEDPGRINYLRRPLCLKSGSVKFIELFLTPEHKLKILADQHGALIPHELLNPSMASTPPPPSLIILPNYQPAVKPKLEPISKARLVTQLMGCHVNARNLANHGFTEIIDIARSKPAYHLYYDRLEDAEELLNRLVDG